MADNSGYSNAAAQVAGAAVTAAGNYAIESAKTKKQWKYQQKSLQLQQQMNKEAWDMQNAYNTPQAQMERLQLAGLNPRLIYGSAGGSSSLSGPVQVADAPVREAPSGHIPEDMFYKYIQTRQADAQYAATIQNMRNMERKNSLMEIQQSLENLKLFRENMRAKNYKALTSAELDQQRFITWRTEELFQNEKTKGDLMDQLKEFRKKQMTGMDLDNAFKTHRNELSKLGIYTSDHPAFRVLIQAANRMGVDLGALLAEGAKSLKYLLELGK